MRVLLDVSAVPRIPGAPASTSWSSPGPGGVATPSTSSLLARRGDARPVATASGPRRARCTPLGARARARCRLVWEQVGGPRSPSGSGVDLWHGPHYTLPLRLRIPSVVTVHDLTLLEHPEWHERAEGRLLPAHDPGRGRARVGVRVREPAHGAGDSRRSWDAYGDTTWS